MDNYLAGEQALADICRALSGQQLLMLYGMMTRAAARAAHVMDSDVLTAYAYSALGRECDDLATRFYCRLMNFTLPDGHETDYIDACPTKAEWQNDVPMQVR